MELEYNGVRMELLQLDRVERDAVYTEDGLDLLYIRWLIGATCIYGNAGRPVGVAAKNLQSDTVQTVHGIQTRVPSLLRGSEPFYPTFVQETNTVGNTPGQNALFTDAELRTRLWTPRRKLTIGAYSTPDNTFNYWLQSPRPGFSVDLVGGPKPLAVDIISSQGDGNTFAVHFQIETCISPCQGAAEQLVLSHRWQMTHDHDDDGYLTRITEGVIVFNMQFVVANGINPDSFRQQFFHPIPLGFKRKLGPIVLSSDGTTIKYVLIDTDQTVVFDAGDSGATQMEIVENLQYMQPWRVIGGKV